MSKTIFKSIGAFLAAMIVVVVLSVGTDAVLEKNGIFPPATEGLFVTWMLLLALFYRSVYTVLGGYVMAKLAPQNPMRHVKVLGIIGTILATLGTIAGWNLSQHWYPIALAVTALPLTWLGGTLHKRN